ncbi:MAG: HigA family addiction module antitoxin [Planctomycetales bacterium]
MPRRKAMPPVHPGEILQEEFLSPLGISQYRLAKETSVPPRRINEIVRGSRAITANTALRLARYFETTDRFWLNLQARYDLELEKDRLGDRLNREVQVFTASRGGAAAKRATAGRVRNRGN